MTKKELVALRSEIERIDSEILESLARRIEVSREIGLTKAKDGVNIKDLAREKTVRANFARDAKRLGIAPQSAVRIANLLISDSVSVQKQKVAGGLRGKNALVIGGAGRMGEWTCRFLSNRGAEVRVWDERGKLPGYENLKSPNKFAATSQIVVLAGPIGRTPSDLKLVIDSSPRGVVFDLCSVKSHIATELTSACRRGLLVTSVHPMFGPNAPSPEGRNVVVCDCGSKKANRFAELLFSSAGADVSLISLEKHDELMAYILGLSHLCTLLFSRTIIVSGKSLVELNDASGPSFEKLIKMASELSNESKRVYHDIQFLNPHAKRVISEMGKVLKDLERASLSENPAAFGKMMESSRQLQEVR